MSRYCVDCKATEESENGHCPKCDSQDSVTGDFTVDDEGNISCVCGSKEFKQIMHLNMNPIYLTSYECVSCGNVIQQKTYYESPYM